MTGVKHMKWWGWGLDGVAFHHEDKPGFAPFVLNAVKLMYVGAAVSTVSLVISLVSIGGTKEAIKKAKPSLTAAQVNQLNTFIIALAVVSGVIGVALWLWMARKNEQGKNWARILSTVLFALAGWLWLAIGALWMRGLLGSVTHPVGAAWMNRNIEPRTRATVISFREQVASLGEIATSRESSSALSNPTMYRPRGRESMR